MTEEKSTKPINIGTISEAMQAKVGEEGEGQTRLFVPPSYGSQEYWEERYSRNAVDTEDDPLPFHSWYFSYDEMRPLLLPLILGTEQADAILESSAPDAPDGAASPQQSDMQSVNLSEEEESAVRSQTEGDDVKDEKEANTDDVEANVNEEEEDVDEDDDDDGQPSDEESGEDSEEASSEEHDTDGIEMTRAPLSSDPVSILEVGCGDVPMGTGLVMDLPSDHVARVVCIDCSASVIQKMEEKYGNSSEPDMKKIKTDQEPSKKQTTPLEFQKVDAQNMPYSDETFHMVLEKGTLDAILSDRESGSANCQRVIGECARVLKTGGILLFVSHLNAFDPSGIDWMEDVVFGGLRSSEMSGWSIEVHGNDGGDAPPGPAVYVIHKKPKDAKSSKIPVQFCSY